MIYKSSFLKKELKQAYTLRSSSVYKQIGIALFTALLTFSLHFILQTMHRSIFKDVFPFLMEKSHFSTLSLYLAIIQGFFVIYFIIYYDYLSYAEIENNRWYVLVKMGQHPLRLILTKLFVRCIDIATVYTLGFIFTFFITIFLKYPVIVTYYLSLYFAGLLMLLLLAITSMACSLFIKHPENAKYIIILTTIIIWGYCFAFGFYKTITNRVIMSDGLSAFLPQNSIFPIFALLAIIISFMVIIFRAKEVAKFSNFKMYVGDMDYGKDNHIVLSSGTDLKAIHKKDYMKKFKAKSMDIAVKIFLMILILCSLSINILVLLISLSSPEKEIDINGYIPYVFHSETMEPDIMFNDLAFFHIMDEEYAPKVGSIVLYKNFGNEVSVARILSIENEQYEVDIDNYVIDATKGQLHEFIVLEQIYGIFTFVNRWLGALILFGNNTLGRILMLMIPTILIFYYKPISQAIKTIYSKRY